jgi:hypothetical protein
MSILSIGRVLTFQTEPKFLKRIVGYAKEEIIYQDFIC